MAAVNNYDFGHDVEIIAASVRSANHVAQAALMGADIATVPFAALKKCVQHPLTDRGLEAFLKDWEKGAGRMSENEATATAAPRRRRSTNVNAKAPSGKQEGSAPASRGSAARTPRKSVKANTGGRRSRRLQTVRRAPTEAPNRGSSNRQKQNGKQNGQGGQNQRRQRRQHDSNRGPREVQAERFTRGVDEAQGGRVAREGDGARA